MFLAGICLAFSYFGYQASLYQQRVSALAELSTNHTIEAEVLAVMKSPNYTKLSLKVMDIDSPEVKLLLPFTIHLNWYDSTQQIEPGDELQALVKLKPAWGSANQGAFNYGRWLLSLDVVGRGYIKKGTVMARHSLLPRWHRRLQEATLGTPGGNIAYAMLVGDKQYIPQNVKVRWQQSGLGHLMAISGLHLGLVAAWGAMIGRILMLLAPRRLRLLPLVLAMTLAALYGYSANWPISSARAMVMLTVGLSVWQFALSWRPWQAWLLAFFIVTLCWPFSIYSVGFWLSFSTMAWLLVLLWLTGRRRYRLIWIQLGLTLGMLPLQQGFFGYLPLFSMPLNLMVIPLFAWLVVPLLLVASLGLLVHPSIGQWGFKMVGSLLDGMDLLLAQLERLYPLSHHLSSHGWSVVLLGIAFILVLGLCWQVLGLRRGGIVLFAAALLASNRPARLDGWSVNFVDVGQGLSVVVERRGHGLIYDTGARYASGFEFASAALLPLLGHLGIDDVDWLIVSHGDNDHAGGFNTLKKAFPQADIRVGRDPRIRGGACHGHEIWLGLELEFLQVDDSASSYNDSSCVLVVKDERHSLLLTGDIESRSEASLLSLGLRGPISLLSAPHHGSKTSSSIEWVEAIKPQIVVFSAEINNRYGFPVPSVVQRYKDNGSQVVVTGEVGQVRVDMYPQLRVRRYRTDLAPFWYNRLLDGYKTQT